MNYSKMVFIALLFLLVSMFYGCSDNSVNPPDVYEYNGFGPQDTSLYYGSMLSIYLSEIDTTKVVGEMRISDDNKNVMWTDGSIRSSRTYNLTLRSLDAYGTGTFPFGECSLNGDIAENVSPWEDSYVYQCYGEVGYDEDFKLHFGAENHFEIAPNSNFSGVDTNITFFDETVITSHKNCDTVSKSAGLNLTWNVATDYVFIELLQVVDPSADGMYIGNCVLENTGGYNFPVSQLQYYPNGVYTISVTNVKPYFLTDSQGRIIVTTVESKKTIGIVLTD